jgi:hypothetical protein
MELTRGLISTTITDKLQLLSSRSLTHSISQKILFNFFISFQKLIWIPRCEKMNIYKRSSGITSSIKKDFKNYQPIIDQDIHSTYLANAKHRIQQGLTRCKGAIMSLITKGLISAWGIKGFNNN